MDMVAIQLKRMHAWTVELEVRVGVEGESSSHHHQLSFFLAPTPHASWCGRLHHLNMHRVDTSAVHTISSVCLRRVLANPGHIAFLIESPFVTASFHIERIRMCLFCCCDLLAEA